LIVRSRKQQQKAYTIRAHRPVGILKATDRASSQRRSASRELGGRQATKSPADSALASLNAATMRATPRFRRSGPLQPSDGVPGEACEAAAKEPLSPRYPAKSDPVIKARIELTSGSEGCGDAREPTSTSSVQNPRHRFIHRPQKSIGLAAGETAEATPASALPSSATYKDQSTTGNRTREAKAARQRVQNG